MLHHTAPPDMIASMRKPPPKISVRDWPRKSVALPPELWEAVAVYGADRQVATEAEAIRRLVQAGLDAEGVDVPPAAPRSPRKKPAG